MDILTAIMRRASAIKLTAPGPTQSQLDIILEAGVRAPDHGRLAPWRFIILDGDARGVLSEAMVEMRRRLSPESPAEEVAREGHKAMRAPTIVVVAAHIHPPGKVPEIERVVAVGAALQNMILAAHALGLGTMWKTGPAAYDGGVKEALGLKADDHIVGFLYLGAVQAAGTPRAAVLENIVTKL